MKKTFLHTLIFGLFFAILGFFYAYHLPQLKKWVIFQAAHLSNRYLPVRVLIQDISLSAIPLGVSLEKIKLIPKGDLAKTMHTSTADRAILGVNLLSVLTGKKNIYDVELTGFDGTFIQKEKLEEKTPTPSPLKPHIPIDTLLSLPFHSVVANKTHLKINLENQKITSEVKNLDLELSFNHTTLSIQIVTPEIKIKKEDAYTKPSRIALETQVLIERNTLQVSALKFKKGESVIVGAGLMEGDIQHLAIQRHNYKGRVYLELDEVKNWIHDVLPSRALPSMGGIVDVTFQASKNGADPWEANAQLRSKDLKISQFSIGQVQSDLEFKNSKLTFKQLDIHNKAGEISLGQPSVAFSGKHEFSTNVDIKEMELAELLTQLGLKRPSLVMVLNGHLQCKGEIGENPFAQCGGSIAGKNFRVFSKEKPEKNIIALKEFKVDGSVKVNSVGVYPKATLHVGGSQGEAEGEITYKTGFRFDYTTPQLKFSDVQDLAGLGLEGTAEISGVTQGDGDYATIDMKLKAQEAWLANYGIGDATSLMTYRKGQLKFNDIKGNLRASQYNGTVTIDLPKDYIWVNANLPLIEANDLQHALERKAKLPFEITGAGSGTAVVEGPLEFTKLSYNLKSTLNKGVVASESFDRAHFNVHADKGQVYADRVEITKGAGSITLEGRGFPSGDIDTLVQGRNLQLEELNIFSEKNLGLTGILSFGMTMKGYVFGPQMHLQGSATKVAINQEPIPDSQFAMDINSNAIQGSGSFMGNTIVTNFSFPFKDNVPFVFNLNTVKWNFAPLFSMISSGSRQLGYTTELTSSIHIAEPQGHYRYASGKAEISTFLVRKNSLEMTAPKPLRIHVDNGIVKVDHFFIKGDNTQLTAETKPSTPPTSVVQVSGTVDMGLLSFLTPFLQEIRGILSLSTQIRFEPNRVDLLGSAYIDQGYVKLKEFPHALEQLKADILFNQKRVNINSFSAAFAGGRATVGGYIELEGYKNFPAHLSMHLDDTTLIIPKGVSSRGTGDATITRSWFPYLLQGTYTVSSGLVDRPFQNDDSAEIRRSSFLPKMLLQGSFDPVEFNIQTILNGPYNIRNSVLDTGIAGNLQIKGTPSNPVLLGEITLLRGGKVYFRETPFDINTGSAKFDGSQEINPLIFGSARARVKSREYETTAVASSSSQNTTPERSQIREYDVNLIVQGRMKNLRINLSSQPPLDEPDIISLLALGVTSRQLELKQSGEQAADLGSAILSQNFKVKNPLFDVKITSTQDSGDNTSNDSKVTLSRQITPKMSTSVGRTFRTNVTDAKVRYQLNDSLSAILNWEGRQNIEEDTKTITKPPGDTVGVGLEYGVEFK